MGWFERIISMDGRLQGKARRDRRLVFLTGIVVLAIAAPPTVFADMTGHNIVLLIMSVVPQLAIIIMCLCRVHLTHNIIRAYLGTLAAHLIGYDMTLRTVASTPVWSAFVLLADLSLVIGLGRRFATGLTAVAAVWIIVITLESVLRVGLYNLPGSAPDWRRWEQILPYVSCTHPPCPANAGAAAAEMNFSIAVLLIDFAATRGFAESAEKEKASMGRTIETVEAIAQLLAGYDVDTVAEMLQEAEAEGRLPAAMHEALRRLEENLRAYRPYLPKSCLPAQDCDNDAQDVMSQLSLSGRSASFHTDSTGSERVEVHATATAAAKLLGALKTVRATMVVVNTRNALPCLGQDPHTFTSFFNMLLTNTMSAVESRRGLVDMFIGDRILASFNTSRPCLVHGTAAVGAVQDVVRAVRSNATRRVSNTECDSAAGACAAQNSVDPLSNENNDGNSEGPLRVNIGAASGRVLCGDTGYLEMRRFSLLGVLPLMACGMERAARAFGLDVVCNTTLQQDAVHEHVLLLVPRLVRFVKQSVSGGVCVRNAVFGTDEKDNGTCRVHELLVHAEGADTSILREGEWMYHIGAAAAEWEPYNAAMHTFLSTHNMQEAAELAGEHHKQAHSTISLLGHATPLDVHV